MRLFNLHIILGILTSQDNLDCFTMTIGYIMRVTGVYLILINQYKITTKLNFKLTFKK